MSKPLFVVCGVCLALSMTAQEAPVVRQEIVVTADRVPTRRDEVTSAAAVVEHDAIARAPAASATDVLTLVPGLSVFSSRGTTPATIAVRGFYGGGEVEYARLLVDGIAVGDVESGVAQWQSVRAEEIERVEVARSVASPLYGDAAFGGVVQLFTRRRDAGDWIATVGVGSFGSRDAAAGAWGNVAGGRVAVLADVSSSEGNRPHDAGRRAGARVTWNRGLLTLAAERRTIDRDEAGPLPLDQLEEPVALPVYRFDGDQSARLHLAATFDAARWRASLHVSSRSGEGVRTFLLIPPAVVDRSARQVESGEIGGSLLTTQSIGAIEWRGGVDAAAQKFSAEYFDEQLIAEADADRDVLAGFVSARTRVGSRVIASAGLRADVIRDRDARDSRRITAWSPRVALHFDLGAAIYIAAAGGFKAPTIEQLFDTRPLRLFGSSIVFANPDLVPQRARTIEGGIARDGRFGRWQADVYLTRVTNEIDFDPATFRYGNINRSEHRGAELLFEPRRALAPRLTYTWMRVASRDDRERQLKNIPEHSFSAMITARLTLGVSATAVYVWNGHRWLDDANTIAAPDTHDLSLRLARAFGSLTVRVDVFNATDSRNLAMGFVQPDLRGMPHAYAWPDARRSLRLSIEWTRRRPASQSTAVISSTPPKTNA